MSVTTIDLDQRVLELAKSAAGVKSNRQVVDQALRTLIAVRSQPAAVERIIARTFTDAQTSADVVHYSAPSAEPDRGDEA